jgi:hypothetical protein
MVTPRTRHSNAAAKAASARMRAVQRRAHAARGRSAVSAVTRGLSAEVKGAVAYASDAEERVRGAVGTRSPRHASGPRGGGDACRPSTPFKIRKNAAAHEREARAQATVNARRGRALSSLPRPAPAWERGEDAELVVARKEASPWSSLRVARRRCAALENWRWGAEKRQACTVLHLSSTDASLRCVRDSEIRPA